MNGMQVFVWIADYADCFQSLICYPELLWCPLLDHGKSRYLLSGKREYFMTLRMTPSKCW